MSNQQVTEKNILSNLTHIWNSLNLLSNLRDFTWRSPARGLRYSPLYLNNIISTKLNIINVYKVLKRKLSINHLENKLDPNWVTGFVDAEGCFSVVIEISEIFKRKVRISLYKILPHFDTYPLLNLKQKDYICFKKCMTTIKLKKHLTTEGLKTLKKLNSEMNCNRYK